LALLVTSSVYLLAFTLTYVSIAIGFRIAEAVEHQDKQDYRRHRQVDQVNLRPTIEETVVPHKLNPLDGGTQRLSMIIFVVFVGRLKEKPNPLDL
jgi:hypothetical protein